FLVLVLVLDFQGATCNSRTLPPSFIGSVNVLGTRIETINRLENLRSNSNPSSESCHDLAIDDFALFCVLCVLLRLNPWSCPVPLFRRIILTLFLSHASFSYLLMNIAPRTFPLLALLTLFLVLGSQFTHAAASNDSLQASAAEIDITPPAGMRMAGYFDER